MNQGILCMDLSQTSQDYLARLSSAAPQEYFSNPQVILSNPAIPILYEEVTELVGITTSITPLTNKALLSPRSGHPEYCVICRADAALELAFPRAVAGFHPYFVWTLDVNRSRSCRRFAVNMTNSLLSDNSPLTGTIRWEPLDGPLAATFNSETQELEREPFRDAW